MDSITRSSSGIRIAGVFGRSMSCSILHLWGLVSMGLSLKSLSLFAANISHMEKQEASFKEHLLVLNGPYYGWCKVLNKRDSFILLCSKMPVPSKQFLTVCFILSASTRRRAPVSHFTFATMPDQLSVKPALLNDVRLPEVWMGQKYHCSE